MTTVVALTGTKGAGKDTAAEELVQNQSFTKIKFADGLKAMISAYLTMYGYDSARVERMIEGDLKETPDDAWCGRSTRFAMQTLGTEWGRIIIGPKLWTNLFKKRATDLGRVVVTDLRFVNECMVVKEVDPNAKIVRIIRGANDAPIQGAHASEIELWGLPVTDIIPNTGTPEELREQLRTVVAG
jgi:adenylate kinase family enzyme